MMPLLLMSGLAGGPPLMSIYWCGAWGGPVLARPREEAIQEKRICPIPIRDAYSVANTEHRSGCPHALRVLSGPPRLGSKQMRASGTSPPAREEKAGDTTIEQDDEYLQRTTTTQTENNAGGLKRRDPPSLILPEYCSQDLNSFPSTDADLRQYSPGQGS